MSPAGTRLSRQRLTARFGVLRAVIVGVAPRSFLRVGQAHRTVAVAAANHPLERRDDLRSGLRLPGPGVLRENRLDLLPQSLGNDGLVLSRIALPLVDHLAPIGAVAEQAVDVAGVPRAPWPMFSLLRGPGLGAVALLVELGAVLPQRPVEQGVYQMALL